jgi:hypothetical protein
MSIQRATLPNKLLVIPADDPLLRKRRRTDVFWQEGDLVSWYQGDTDGTCFTTSAIFRFEEPVTLSAYDIPDNAQIRCELLEVVPTTANLNLCGSFAYNLVEGTIASQGFLQAPGLRVQTNGEIVATDWNINIKKPIAILSGMQKGQFYHLIYETNDCPNVGPEEKAPFPFTVPYTDTTDEDWLIMDQGLQNVSFSDRPDLWIPTGTKRCLLPDDPQTGVDTGNGGGTRPREERLLIGPGGQTYWLYIRDLHWMDTCCIRDPGSDANVEKQQATFCGHTKWIVGDPMLWTDTGRRRTRQSDGQVEKQQSNNFGRFRWVNDPVYVASICFVPYPEFGTSETRVAQAQSGSGTSQSTLTITTSRTSVARTVEVGYGFPATGRDPAATVATTHPVTGVANACYLYPTPRPGATVEVWSSLTSTPPAQRTLVGYARNNPLGWFPQASNSWGNSTGMS